MKPVFCIVIRIYITKKYCLNFQFFFRIYIYAGNYIKTALWKNKYFLKIIAIFKKYLSTYVIPE